MILQEPIEVELAVNMTGLETNKTSTLDASALTIFYHYHQPVYKFQCPAHLPLGERLGHSPPGGPMLVEDLTRFPREVSRRTGFISMVSFTEISN